MSKRKRTICECRGRYRKSQPDWLEENLEDGVLRLLEELSLLRRQTGVIADIEFKFSNSERQHLVMIGLLLLFPGFRGSSYEIQPF